MARRPCQQLKPHFTVKAASVLGLITLICACSGRTAPAVSSAVGTTASAVSSNTDASDASSESAQSNASSPGTRGSDSCSDSGQAGTASGLPEVSNSDPSTAAADGSGADSSSSSGPTVLSTGDVGRPLTLTDFFQSTGDWKDDRYNVANKTGITGVGELLNNCGGDPDVLELRLAEGFNTLSMTIGQANDSPDSDQIVDVQVVANGVQTDSQHVPFNRLQPLSESVKGVNALQIGFQLNSVACQKSSPSGGVNVVITDLTLH